MMAKQKVGATTYRLMGDRHAEVNEHPCYAVWRDGGELSDTRIGRVHVVGRAWRVWCDCHGRRPDNYTTRTDAVESLVEHMEEA